MESKQATQEQIKEFWERCGLVHIDNTALLEVANSCEAMAIDKPISGWYKPDYQKGSSKLVSLKGVPILSLNNLFLYAVPIAVKKLESRFDDKTNLVRGLELLFRKWIDKVSDGYSIEDALFWAIKKVIKRQTFKKERGINEKI